MMDDELRQLEQKSLKGDLDATLKLSRLRQRARLAPGPCWVGIDPGKSGYVALLGADNSLRTWATPVIEVSKGDGSEHIYDLRAVAQIGRELAAAKPKIVMLERQQPAYVAPGQQKAFNNLVRASFAIGYGFAMWETILTCFDLHYETVMPASWMKKMQLTAPSKITDRAERAKARKGTSVEMAMATWPAHDFRRTPRCKPSPDQCEAALLAEFGRRTYG